MSSAQTIERVLVWVRRTLAVVFGVPITIGISMSLVDSYRRRGKKPKPFPTVQPRTVEVGDGRITTYTFGKDLYDDMLAAIDGAQRQVLFETYIWKGDETGERFKRALVGGGPARCGGLLHLRRVRQPGRVADLQAVPAGVKMLRYPGLHRRFALRPAPLRTRPPQDPGRRRRVGFVGRLQHRLRLRDRVARHPHPHSRPRRVGPQAGVRRLLEPPTAVAGCSTNERPLLLRDGLHVGATVPVPAQRAAAVDVPDPLRCTSRRSTAPAATSG